MIDRFDLEQDILRCWTMVDDVKKFSEQITTEEQYKALSIIYDIHFERLWKTFETLVAEGKIK